MDLKARGGLWMVLVVTLAVIKEGLCQTTITNPPSPVTTTEGTSFQIRCGLTTVGDPQYEGVRIKRIVSEEEGTTKEETLYQSLPPDWVTTKFNKDKYSYEEVQKLDVRLTVKSASFFDGGLYICEAIVDANDRASVQVVILGEPLLTLPTINTGEQFKALCQVQFMAHEDIREGNPHFPQLVADVDGRALEGTTIHTSGTLGEINSQIELTVNTTLTKSSDGKNITCTAMTTTPAGETRVAQLLDIRYAVTEPELPKNDLFYVGDVIICNADGNPEPTRKWMSIQSKRPGTYTNNLTIIAQMIGDPREIWKCVATNKHKGVERSEEHQIEFSVEQKDDGNAGENVQPQNNNVAIALGVTIPLIVIAVAVGIVGFVFFRRRKVGKKLPADDTVAVNTAKNAENSETNSYNNGKTGPLSSDATYEEPKADRFQPPKPNSHGHNVKLQVEDPAAPAKRSVTPLYEVGQEAGDPYYPQYANIPEYPDMASAHPGLQRAMQGQDTSNQSPIYSSVNKPKPQPREPDAKSQEYVDTEV